jgi:hypothetical protein
MHFQLMLTLIISPGGPKALTLDAARSPCGPVLDDFPTNSRQALQSCITVSRKFFNPS